MSCVAFVASRHITVLLSDGLAINVEGLKPGPDMFISEERIVRRNHSKIAKVNGSVGIAWTGSLCTYLPEFVEALNPNQTPGDIAKDLTDLTREKIADSYSHLMPHAWFNVNAHLIGYEDGNPMYYHIVKKNGNIQCNNGTQLPEVASACSIPYCDNAQQLFADMVKVHAVPGMHIKDVAVGAFKRLINEQSRPGLPLGGTIFTELITNPE